MQLYTLMPDEVATVGELNSRRQNVLLIVCRFGSSIGVDPDALQEPAYSDYLDALGSYESERVVELPDPPIV